MSDYRAKLATPFAVLGIRTAGADLTGIDFLSLNEAPLAPRDAVAEAACRELEAYLEDPEYRFRSNLAPRGTAFQQRVWRAMMEIPCGRTLSYGEIARLLGSAARAVGQACGANPIPVMIPCHRVLARGGRLGGFMNSSGGDPLAIKHWLLFHERALG